MFVEKISVFLLEYVSIVSDLVYFFDGVYLVLVDDNWWVIVFILNDYEVWYILLVYMRLCVDYYVIVYMYCRNLEWFLMECWKYLGNYFGFDFYYGLRLVE